LQEIEARYRQLLADSEKRHEECQRDRDALRDRIGFLEDELRGLIRLIAQNSAGRVLKMGDDVPQDIREAAERVENILLMHGRKTGE
jgi:hypothetical protein